EFATISLDERGEVTGRIFKPEEISRVLQKHGLSSAPAADGTATPAAGTTGTAAMAVDA
ncbi:hypothetical protein CF319_g8664, partial [Tilletia indica]